MFRRSFSASSNSIPPTLCTAARTDTKTITDFDFPRLFYIGSHYIEAYVIPFRHMCTASTSLAVYTSNEKLWHEAEDFLKVEQMNTMRAFVKKERFVHVVSNSYPFSLKAQYGLCWYGNQCHDQHYVVLEILPRSHSRSSFLPFCRKCCAFGMVTVRLRLAHGCVVGKILVDGGQPRRNFIMTLRQHADGL